MKRTIIAAIAAIAALLMTGAANAKGPELPSEFRGSWCGVDAEAKIWARRANCMASSMLDVRPTELVFHEATCTLAYVKPAKNGRYHTTFACVEAPNDTDTIEIAHYWMRIY